MSESSTKEYEVLSEDRRRAIEIFLKGFAIAPAIMSFGFKLLIDANGLGVLIVIYAAGFLDCKGNYI